MYKSNISCSFDLLGFLKCVIIQLYKNKSQTMFNLAGMPEQIKTRTQNGKFSFFKFSIDFLSNAEAHIS